MSLAAIFVGVLLLMVAVGAIYGWLYNRFWSNRPQLKRNFLAEINAPIRKIPEGERAWPSYRQALIKLKDGLDRWKAEDFEPDSSSWPEIEAFVAAHQVSLAELRESAKLPRLGYLYSDEPQSEDRELEAQADPPRLPSDNPKLLDLLYIPQAKLHRGVNLLLADARVAAWTHDGARATADLVAAASIAKHVQEPRCAVGQLVSWAVTSASCSLVGELVSSDRNIFSDDQLIELDRRLHDFADVGFSIDLSFERAVMEDIEQRWYTDDGQGDGYLYPEPEDGAGFDLVTKALLPLAQREWKAKVVSRAEYHQTIVELFGTAEKELAQPAWTVDKLSCQETVERLAGDKRWFRFEMLLPAFSGDYFYSHRVAMQVDVARVALALVRHQRHHGRWPDRIEELVPDFLDAVPPDRFDGRPLRYLLSAGQPCVYSIGLDRKDDGGKPVAFAVAQELVPLWADRSELDPRSITGDVVLWPEPKVPSAGRSRHADQIGRDASIETSR